MSESSRPFDVPTQVVAAQVREALAEDIGSGDVTAALIPAARQADARVVSREAGILCGSAWFDEVFRQLNRDIHVAWQAQDGAPVDRDTLICTLRGPARSLLTGERTALNFLQTLSGTATAACHYARAVAGSGARVLDTRKTLPGLRLAQKYAVRCGGCDNHRTGLFDMVLIKENHITSAGSIAAAVTTAKTQNPDLPIEVEVESLTQLREALAAGAHRVLLDNMDLDTLREAVALNQGRALLEASGGVTLDNIRTIAATGVNFISVGAITKHVHALDLSMRLTSSEATE
ncbi:MAG: carboxylating nicotinate-nucleotide diphosphorylase [Pseudomonadota bacterium]|nr:MAG: carboxylating nicotinate-nucleotide diphosphorylase [Pseudomonadota bacterium]